MKLSPHFDSQEFACKCLIRGLRSTPGSCQGQEWVSEKLVEKLEELRAALGNKPITVTSGCRCLYNRYVGGAKGSSMCSARHRHHGQGSKPKCCRRSRR